MLYHQGVIGGMYMNFNPYNQYPYGGYGSINYQQPQTNYLPLTFVNGIEGAKAFIVGANQTVYLKDSDSNILFEKRADSQGKYSILAYELKQIDLNNVGKPAAQVEYVTIADFKSLENKLKRLSNKIDKLSKPMEELGDTDE